MLQLLRPKLRVSIKILVNKMNEVKEIRNISEGLANIKTSGKVFYNPVQEFNRDLSISVISTFAKEYFIEKKGKEKEFVLNPNEFEIRTAGDKYEDGLYILEALSATGLRSIRYAKEIPGVREIVANDFSAKAVEDIKNNVRFNDIEHLVTPNHEDATILMYQHRKHDRFDVIDLDPYGCPSMFLDSAVQAVNEGGLLLVTATDMAVLAGNSPETCYSKYGAISIKTKSCHEVALRILLQCIESHANRYGRYIVPLLSLSADFYIRVFVRVYSGAHKCKYSTSKLSHVYQCTGCDSFTLQPLGIIKMNDKNVKFKIPTGPPVSHKCEHCGQPHHIGGPIWSAPLHSPEFVRQVLDEVRDNFGTIRRIQGVLNVIQEELIDTPLYYTLEKLCGTIHVEQPQMMSIRSAILNAGYRVSFTHMNPTSIKTDAPTKVIWDIMRCWEKTRPASKKRLIEGSPAFCILSKEPEKEYSFKLHPAANPESKKLRLVRFQENPLPHWGPGFKNTAMIGDQKILKSQRNQGKRKKEGADCMEPKEKK
ncbi:tRNA (guanine(26)-N(2))-dimethyltransferase [Diorhabda sublineata]|uniref:tRNA (guanine(26)-N(2))-dimethyltransferase n=1 Tax=Diorhabda sublineata TaxID=1163346 RepID=UPI0024E05CCC|nr:tRNA (guanine(26)-N(2))-dimethyltransferase [Diorhabda sublineata]